jgi:hypothetical protein
MNDSANQSTRYPTISKAADFDSAIPRFESWRPSQDLTNKIKQL